MYVSRPAALAAVVLLLTTGLLAGTWLGERLSAAQGPRVFELRTYTAPEGKLGELHARFRDHTLRIFERHGMTNVVYLKPLDAPLSDNTLVYLLAHPSREAAKANWAAFAADPEWKKVASESQVNGRILSKVESVFFEAADYSPMK
jgi:NIPSNAP